MLFGGFAPPAARQTSAVFFIVIAPTEILHFYLELADETAKIRAQQKISGDMRIDLQF